MQNIIQNHTVLLKDNIRMNAYDRAISAAVTPGSTVLDIGCGLGILSFMALSAGASRVHAIEVEPATLDMARRIAKHNGLEGKITFHKGLSTKVKMREKVDIIISELFGNLGLNENLLPVIADARKRFLKEGGRIIPEGIKVFLAPCEHKDWSLTAKFMHDVHGFDLLPDDPEMDLGTPSVIIKRNELLARAAVFADVNLNEALSPVAENEVVFQIERDGILTGFAGWFEATLFGDISFTTIPEGLTTHWKQALLPLRKSVVVRAGQKIKLALEIAPDMGGLNSVIGYHYDIVA